MKHLIEQIKRRYNTDRNLVADGPDVTWADFTLLEIIEALEKRVGQLEEQLADTKLLPGDAYKDSGKSIIITWDDFWAESRIEELEKRVGQLEEQLADTGRDDPELKCPYCNETLLTDQEYMDDTFGPNWREYVKDEDVSIYCSGCGRAWVADELLVE